MVANTPRVRADLKVTAAEEDGAKCFDVVDPTSGLCVRIYELEWLIAQRMDGARSFDEIATWAQQRMGSLGVKVTPEDLARFAERLRASGFLEGEPVAAVEPAPVPVAQAPVPVAVVEPEPSRPNKVSDPKKLKALMQTVGDTGSHPVINAPETSRPTGQAVDNMKDFFRKAPLEEEEAPPPRRRGASLSSGVISAIGIVAVLTAFPVLVYVTFLRPEAVAKVHVHKANPEELTDLYDGAAAIHGIEPTSLAFTDAGKIGVVVARGAEVPKGMQLATLEAASAGGEDLGHLQRRLEFYVKQLATAKASGKAAEIDKAEKKVAEKKSMIASLAHGEPAQQLMSPTAGKIVDVFVAPGGMVTAGQPILKIADPRLQVEVTLGPGEASAFDKGNPVSLHAGGRFLSARVASIEGEKIEIDVTDPAAKNGDEVQLVKRHLIGVVTVPAKAVVKRGGVSSVYVLTGGQAKARVVTVLDRMPTEVKVSSGLGAEDVLIVDPPQGLQDGDKAIEVP